MRRFTPLGLLFCAIGVGWAVSARLSRSAPALPSPPTLTRLPYDPTLVHRNVAFYAKLAQSDPQGAIGYAMLAKSYLQRCRVTGDIADALRAEQSARHSLALRTRRNADGYNQLALALLTQHRFSKALAAADLADKVSPDNEQTTALRAEIHLECGDYEAAEQILREAAAQGRDPGLDALWGRLAEINGKPEEALAYLRGAAAAADNNRDMPLENVAWYHLRVGDYLFLLGKADAAEKEYKQALALFPQDYRALTGLERLAAGRGDWNSAISWGEQTVKIVPLPEAVALLGDAYAASGDRQKAEAQYRLIEAFGAIARAQGMVYDRQRALFLADHDRNLQEALTLARREMTIRHDVFAYDTLAWACFKNGLLKEADAAITKALSRGTQNALLFYHAGRIAHALGDPARAKDFLQRALALNPYFQPFAPTAARALLAR